MERFYAVEAAMVLGSSHTASSSFSSKYSWDKKKKDNNLKPSGTNTLFYLHRWEKQEGMQHCVYL